MTIKNKLGTGYKIAIALFTAVTFYQCSAQQQAPTYYQQQTVPSRPQDRLREFNQSIPPELRLPGYQGGVTCHQSYDAFGQLVTKCLPN